MRERMAIQAHKAVVFMVYPPYAVNGFTVKTGTFKRELKNMQKIICAMEPP